MLGEQLNEILVMKDLKKWVKKYEPKANLVYFSDGTNNCVNIDECQSSITNECPTNSECVDTDGSYYCQCKSGYGRKFSYKMSSIQGQP